MSNFPFFWKRLEMAMVVRTEAARDRYVLMAALCWPSPWYTVAELKLGQNIHRKSVPVRTHIQKLSHLTLPPLSLPSLFSFLLGNRCT